MEEVAAPLAGFARPDPAFGGEGHGVGNQFLLGDLKAAGSRQRQDLVRRLDLLELAADLAMGMHKILKPKEHIRHAGAGSRSGVGASGLRPVGWGAKASLLQAR